MFVPLYCYNIILIHLFRNKSKEMKQRWKEMEQWRMSCGVCFLLAGFICWIVVGYGGSAPSTAGELHSNKFIPFFVSASSPLLSFGFAPAKRTASLIDSFVLNKES